MRICSKAGSHRTTAAGPDSIAERLGPVAGAACNRLK